MTTLWTDTEYVTPADPPRAKSAPARAEAPAAPPRRARICRGLQGLELEKGSGSSGSESGSGFALAYASASAPPVLRLHGATSARAGSDSCRTDPIMDRSMDSDAQPVWAPVVDEMAARTRSSCKRLRERVARGGPWSPGREELAGAATWAGVLSRGSPERLRGGAQLGLLQVWQLGCERLCG